MVKKRRTGWLIGISVSVISSIAVGGYFGSTAVIAFSTASDLTAQAAGMDSEIADATEYIGFHETAKKKTDQDILRVTNELSNADWQLRPFKERELGHLTQESIDRSARLLELNGELATMRGEQIGLNLRATTETAYGERQLLIGGLFVLLLVIVLLLMIFGARRGTAADQVLAKTEID
ncbi:hypothetical protein QBL02_12980 [Leucobacter sp. UT-8R-CII-1-4]|uniref:hypothetical protein n=1 Tax=Leucobacter sp. UT-8R-CII-1-4 TaxID=3040075 RepID=UPI0024A7EAC0|nr:hypothetical protein [Leucobacter sp. UT-8R-CII-1-4]MDI6024454.1 hypothetical protein [Leucobacter sp. UT-8R-CII-1-4]